MKRIKIINGNIVENLINNGEEFIIAPNHIKGGLLRKIGLIEDALLLIKIFKKIFKIIINALFKIDLPSRFIVKGRLRKIVYKLHVSLNHPLKMLFLFGRGFGVLTNSTIDNEGFNSKIIKKVIKSLRKHSLLIFPYGKWYKSWDQEFITEKDLKYDQKTNKFKFKKPNDDGYEDSLKVGCFLVGKESEKSIVPTIIEKYKRKSKYKYIIAFGEPISTKGVNLITIAVEYLAAMRELKKLCMEEVYK